MIPLNCWGKQSSRTVEPYKGRAGFEGMDTPSTTLVFPPVGSGPVLHITTHPRVVTGLGEMQGKECCVTQCSTLDKLTSHSQSSGDYISDSPYLSPWVRRLAPTSNKRILQVSSRERKSGFK